MSDEKKGELANYLVVIDDEYVPKPTPPFGFSASYEIERWETFEEAMQYACERICEKNARLENVQVMRETDNKQFIVAETDEILRWCEFTKN